MFFRFDHLSLDLFPAHAGVILMVDMGELEEEPFPRTRGGDPTQLKIHGTHINFSPHTRG